MTDAERLGKLEAALKLIRDVEFSYHIGSDERDQIYSFVAKNFSFLGWVGQFMQRLKEAL